MFSLLFSSATLVCAQETPALVLNQPVEREIKGGETHVFAVQLGTGNTARVTIEQKGVDVSLAARRASGERFI